MPGNGAGSQKSDSLELQWPKPLVKCRLKGDLRPEFPAPPIGWKLKITGLYRERVRPCLLVSAVEPSGGRGVNSSSVGFAPSLPAEAVSDCIPKTQCGAGEVLYLAEHD